MTNALRLVTYAVAGLYDRVREELEELIKRGEVKEHEKTMLLDAIDKREVEVREHNRFRELQTKLDTAVQKIWKRLPAMTSQRETYEIRDQLEELTSRIKQLEAEFSAHAS